MRIDCFHYESRTYPNGDTVRKCDLDLAPEAPWRCPADCPKYERRKLDAAWEMGSLGPDLDVAEPASLGEDDSIAALLDEAEDIVNAAGPGILSELERDRAKQQSGLGRFLRRFRRR